jgi:hypothetical protein
MKQAGKGGTRQRGFKWCNRSCFTLVKNKTKTRKCPLSFLLIFRYLVLENRCLAPLSFLKSRRLFWKRKFRRTGDVHDDTMSSPSTNTSARVTKLPTRHLALSHHRTPPLGRDSGWTTVELQRTPDELWWPGAGRTAEPPVTSRLLLH